MQPEGPLNTLMIFGRHHETQVLRDAGAHLGPAIAVGHLVTEHGAQARPVHRIADDIKAALDEVGAGVMIDQTGGSVFDGVNQADEGAGADAFAIKRLIQGPPQALENLRKVARRRTGDRQAARIGAVKVRMGANATGQYILDRKSVV